MTDFSSSFSANSLVAFACSFFIGWMPLGANAQSIEPSKMPVVPQTAEQWKQAAINDIQEVFQLTLDNHPGVYDPHNPNFVSNLTLEKNRAMSLVPMVTNAATYAAVIQRFSTSFHDGHAGVVVRQSVSLPSSDRWPGFVTAWRGDALYVYASETENVKTGDEVISCDRKPIKEIIKDNVFSSTGKIDEAGQWWVKAGFAFYDDGDPFITLPKRCQFNAAGKKNELELGWKPLSDQTWKWINEARYGYDSQVGLREPRARLFWVAMPTFMPDKKQIVAYRAIFKEVEEHRQRYLDSDAIVIDLRHNQGGSSEWSLDFASALWGDGRVERRQESNTAGQKVWWRASKENTDYFTGLISFFEKQKRIASAEWAKKNSDGMREALVRGDKYFVAGHSGADLTKNDLKDLPSDVPAFTKPVYVIVPGQCASACLDAIDTFTLFPNTKLIGAPSSADTTYMDVRVKDLASGLAYVVIPNKLYFNRPRANGQIYTPAIVVNDLEWSTENFLKVVEKDLVKK